MNCFVVKATSPLKNHKKHRVTTDENLPVDLELKQHHCLQLYVWSFGKEKQWFFSGYVLRNPASLQIVY